MLVARSTTFSSTSAYNEDKFEIDLILRRLKNLFIYDLDVIVFHTLKITIYSEIIGFLFLSRDTILKYASFYNQI